MGYTIPAAAWKQYKDKLRRIDSKAADLMQKYAEAHGFQIDDEMVQYAYAVSTKYGEASGALAADMYDSIAEYYMENSKSARNIPYAEVADPASERDVKNALYSAEAQNRTGEIPQRVSRLVRQCGADTVMKNAIRDRAEWAWVPSGDTCAFCLTLASNGWQPASRAQLNGNHAQHIHNNCDCTFAIRFDKETNVEGYDPKVYRRIYDRNGGDINAIRRELYADTKNIETGEYLMPKNKLSGFLLKPGAKHSDEFFSVGYTQNDTEKLNEDIHRNFRLEDAVDNKYYENGSERFSIFMNLGVNETKTFRTVWMKDSKDSKPRFITAYREGRRK